MYCRYLILFLALPSVQGQGIFGNPLDFLPGRVNRLGNLKIWGSWRSWSACDRTCGNGVQTRIRNCVTVSGSSCSGTERRSCSSEISCTTTWIPQPPGRPFLPSVQWSLWNNWLPCSEKCGEGTQIRVRNCVGHGNCFGQNQEQRSCSDRSGCRPFRGQWENWNNWLSCSVRCGTGVQFRTRLCRWNNDCVGRNEEQRPCYERDGCVFRTTTMSPTVLWSSWNECSVTCGLGRQVRTRNCPRDSTNCPRELTQTRSCSMRNCPEWSNWESWLECSASCGMGVRLRKRSCRSEGCVGKTTDVEECSEKQCKEDSVWSNWGQWSECSATCGGGIRKRERTCDGKQSSCGGPSIKTIPCNTRECHSVPRWGKWQKWSECSVTCGEGVRTRKRKCRTTKAVCVGARSETKYCRPAKCPVNKIKKGWTAWENWMECSASCGRGIRLRKRSCNNKSNDCDGKRTDLSECNNKDCNEKSESSEWNAWSEWSKCTVTCGGGIRRRKRTCEGKLNNCPGSNSNIVHCNVEICQVLKSVPVWGGWEQWSTCSKTCGRGSTERNRVCSNEGGGCKGLKSEKSSCKIADCAPVPAWGKWGKWSKCDKTCGDGSRIRQRQCSGKKDSCKGSNTGTRPCRLRSCPVFCTAVKNPENGKMVGKREKYRPGNFLRFSCLRDFTISGVQNITCQHTGAWTNSPPICTEIKVVECKDIKSVPNGFITRKNATRSSPTILTFGCEPEFELKGPESIECNKNGKWSKTPPFCIENTCYRTDQLLESGRKCRKQCDKRSDCKGISKYCLCDGVCGKSCFDPEKVLCTTPKAPKNGFVQYDGLTYGQLAEYTCQPGYSLSGSYHRFCRSDGKWSGNRTRCLKFDTCGQAGDVGSIFSTSAVGARVLAGNSARDGAWPWQAMVVVNQENDVAESLQVLKGGGSILNNQWILTAAHIFDDIIRAKKSNADGHIIILGITTISFDGKYFIQKNAQIFEPGKLIIHPKYKYATENFDYDVAMVKVGRRFSVVKDKFVFNDTLESGRIQFTRDIRPVCIPCAKGVGKVIDSIIRKPFSDEVCRRKTRSSEMTAVTGFGTTSSFSGEGSTVLQQGALIIANDNICKDAMEQIRKAWRNKIFTSRMICATSGKRTSIVDACYGDSGGPLVKKITTSDGTEYWMQVGIVSWGYGCGETYNGNTQYPGFFTKLTSVLPFVVKSIKENSA